MSLIRNPFIIVRDIDDDDSLAGKEGMTPFLPRFTNYGTLSLVRSKKNEKSHTVLQYIVPKPGWSCPVITALYQNGGRIDMQQTAKNTLASPCPGHWCNVSGAMSTKAMSTLLETFKTFFSYCWRSIAILQISYSPYYWMWLSGLAIRTYYRIVRPTWIYTAACIDTDI
jgi:hypothetical protein